MYDYSSNLHSSSVRVDYNYFTKVSVRKNDVTSYYFLNFHGGIFHLRQSI